ncbi:MAG: 1-acyl-sn-glycerol-3-phosphate acyltransferase [Verrucomicrobia bacterium]|nr:1-acyl-sn-glycerol-3-phosphate acyltransferase [Verrucomicrobiota bacterium]
MTRLLFRAMFNQRCHGLDNVPATGGVVIASNHVSFLDPHAVGSVIPRSVFYLARRTLFDRAPWGAVLRSWNVVPVDLSGKPDIAGIKAILGRLEEGHAVLLFPEGTRSPDGHFQPAKAGVGLLAAKAAVPVVPVRIFNASELWPKGRRWPRRGQLDVVYGEPVNYNGMFADAKAKGGREAKEIYQKIADDILERIKALRLPTGPCEVKADGA